MMKTRLLPNLIKTYALVVIVSGATHLIPNHEGEWLITVLAYLLSIAIVSAIILTFKTTSNILPKSEKLLRVKYATLFHFSGWLHLALGFAFWLILIPSLFNGKWDEPLFNIGFWAVFGTSNGIALLFRHKYVCFDKKGVYTYSPLNSGFTNWSNFKEVIVTSSTIKLKKNFSFKVPLAIEIYNSESNELDQIPIDKISVINKKK